MADDNNDAPQYVDERQSRKQAAKQNKRTKREEEDQNRNKFEFEDYQVKKKSEQHDRKNQRRKERDEDDPNTNDNTQPTGVKKSKPTPPKSSFMFYKEKQLEKDPDLTNDRVKEMWGALPPEDKEEYVNLAKAEKDRYKQQNQEFKEVKEVETKKKASGKERRRN